MPTPEELAAEQQAAAEAQAQADAAAAAAQQQGGAAQVDENGNPIVDAGGDPAAQQAAEAEAAALAQQQQAAGQQQQPQGVEAQLATLLKGKSAEELDKILRLAELQSKVPNFDRMAGLFGDKEKLRGLVTAMATDYEANYNPVSRAQTRWEIENADMISERGYTEEDIRDAFLDEMSRKYPGFDASSKDAGLEGRVLKDFNSDDKKTLQFLKEKHAEEIEALLPEHKEAGEDAPDPKAIQALIDSRSATLDSFQGIDMDFGDGMNFKFGPDKAPKFKEFAAAIAKNPELAYQSRYIKPGAEGTDDEHDFGSQINDEFLLTHKEDIFRDLIEYGKMLGQGATTEEIAIKFGTKKPAENAGSDKPMTLKEQMLKAGPRVAETQPA